AGALMVVLALIVALTKCRHLVSQALEPYESPTQSSLKFIVRHPNLPLRTEVSGARNTTEVFRPCARLRSMYARNQALTAGRLIHGHLLGEQEGGRQSSGADRRPSVPVTQPVGRRPTARG